MLTTAESPAVPLCSVKIAEPEDSEIVSRVLGGETSLFERIVRRYQDSVYAIARRFLGDGPEAEDAAQEIFLRAYRGLGGFKGQAKLSTWLYRIAYNLCTDRLRSRRLPDRRAETLDERTRAADRDACPENRALHAEERLAVRRAVDGLQGIYREAVILRYYQDMSVEEVSAVLNIPLKTAETRLYRARKALRESLESA